MVDHQFKFEYLKQLHQEESPMLIQAVMDMCGAIIGNNTVEIVWPSNGEEPEAKETLTTLGLLDGWLYNHLRGAEEILNYVKLYTWIGIEIGDEKYKVETIATSTEQAVDLIEKRLEKSNHRAVVLDYVKTVPPHVMEQGGALVLSSTGGNLID